jgi:outer membrane protein OmpA-like peptidoglycan-associated protein
MKSIVFVIAFLTQGVWVNAQTTVDSATVEVTVFDMFDKPRYHDLIEFRGKSTRKSFIGKTDSKGFFSIQLPEGDVYEIVIKALTDEDKYSTLNVPYTDAAFLKSKIKIMYEPARMFNLQNVLFETGSAILMPESKKQLDELIAWMQLKDLAQIEIQGHTDDVGDETKNLTLSYNRAQAVKSYLVKIGQINASRIQVKGMGESQPIASNDLENGRRLNRRTEIHILSGD